MLNPITYTENVVEDFLRYRLTTYSFADPSLHAQRSSALAQHPTTRMVQTARLGTFASCNGRRISWETLSGLFGTFGTENRTRNIRNSG